MWTWPRASAAGVPVLHTPGRNADAVAELAVGLLIGGRPARSCPATADVRELEVFRDGTIPYQRSGVGNRRPAGRHRRPTGRWGGPCSGG